MTPYLRFVLDLPGETVEMFVPELEGTKRPFQYDLDYRVTNMVYSQEPVQLYRLEEQKSDDTPRED